MVRFNDNLTYQEFEEKEYSEILFRGEYLLAERNRVTKERMVVASFNAWQVISTQCSEPIDWGTYIRKLGLSDEPVRTKEDLKREEKRAMDKVNSILEAARGVKNGS